jgi:hypothetical protein
MVTPKGKVPRPPAVPPSAEDDGYRPSPDDATLVVRSPYETNESPNVTRMIYPNAGGAPPPGGGAPADGFGPPGTFTPGAAFGPPGSFTPGAAFGPPNAYGPAAPPPIAAKGPTASQSGAHVAIPEAPKNAPSARALPWWVLPYVIGCLALAAAGAGVLWLQSRFLGHF